MGKIRPLVFKVFEAMAVRFADVIVADNKGIQDYVLDVYGKDSALIAYGGDHVKRSVGEERQRAILDLYGLKRKRIFVHGMPYRA